MTNNSSVNFTGAGSISSAGGDISITTDSAGAITSGTATTDINAGTGAVTLSAGSNGIGVSGNPVTITSANLTTTPSSNANQFLGGNITLGSASSLNAGTGTIELGSGTVSYQSTSNLINNASKLSVNGATLALNGQSETVDKLTVKAGSITGPGSLISTTQIQLEAGTVAASLGGSAGLLKTTAGVATLTGSNNYTGTTNVDQGTLNVNGTTPFGSGNGVTVNNGGTLGGTGTVGGDLTVNSGGTVNPGDNGIGKLGVSNPTFVSGSTLHLTVDPTSRDQLDVAGTVNVNSNANLVFDGAVTSSPGQVITLVLNDSTDTVTGTFLNKGEGATVTINGVNFSLTYKGGTDNNDIQLVQANTTVSVADNVLSILDNGANAAETITLSIDSTDNTKLRIHSTGALFAGSGTQGASGDVLVSIAGLNSITVNTGGGNDTLVVNLGSGDVIPTAINFDGGAGNDSLSIVGGSQGNVTYNYTDSNSGSVVMSQGTVNYTGIEPLTNTGTADNVIFTLPGTEDTTVVLEQVDANTIRLKSTLSPAPSFEFTEFTKPNANGSITINLGDADQTLTIVSLPALNANTNLTINGGLGTDLVNLNVTGGFTVTGNLAINSAAVAQTGPVTVTGTTTFNSPGQDITLVHADNNFIGAVSVTAKDVTLVDTDAIILGASTVTGNLNVTAKGVTDTGTLVVTGTTTISSATFDVVLDDAANNFTGAVSVTAKDVTLVDTDAIILGASTVTGNLNVTAKGVTDTGTLVVTGTTTISSATFDVVLDDAANNFTGAVSVTAKDVTLVDTDAIILGASTVTGNLNVTAKGVTDTGTLSVTGTTTISSATFDVVLDDAANNFTGAVSVTAKDVTLVDTDAIILGASTVTGNLNVTAKGVTDSGALDVDGTTTISSAGFDVELNTATNDFTGAVSVSSANVTLVDTDAIILGASTVTGNLNVTAKGVTDTGALDVDGTTTISSAGFDVELNTATNDFTGAVSVSGANVTLVDIDAIILGASTVTGNLNVTAKGVTDTGTLVVTGTTTISSATFDVVLDDAANNFTGAVSVTAKDVTLVDTDAIILGASTVTGNLNVTAKGVTDSGALDVDGTTTISSAGFDVELNTATNDFTGAVSVSSANVTLVDTDAIILGASTVTGNLNVTAKGVTDTGALDVDGTTTISSAGFDVELNTATNDFTGAVSVSGANVTLVDIDAIILGASTVTGNLNVTAKGVTDSGALDVDGTTTISSAGFDVELNTATNDFTGAVSVSGANVTLVDTDAIILGASTVTGNLNVTAKGVTDTGTLVVTGTTTISSATFDVVLDDAANNFTGAVSVTAKDVTLVDTDAIILGASTVTGNLNVTAKGVTDTGTLVVTGTTTISSATFDVVLDDAANNFTGAVSVTAKDVTLVDTDAIILGASTVTGNLNVTAKGVTDTGTLVVTGTTTISSATFDVVLDDAANNFTGAVSVTAKDVTLVDTDAIILGASTVTGNLNVTAKGVTDTGTLVVTGTTTITSATFDVVLDDAANNFTGAVSVTAKDVTLVDTDAIILGASTVTGNLNVTAKGVTDSGALDVDGTTTISSAGFDVELNTATNDFTGAVSVSGANVTLVDTDAIILGASTVTGNLNVTAKGVTDSGTLSVTGTTTISSAGFDVELNTATNDFTGAVSVSGANVTLVDIDAIILGASTVTGNLNVTAKGVTDSGALDVDGTTTISSAGFDVELNTATNDFTGAVSVSGANVTLVDTDAIILGASTVTGNLNVTAKGVTDSGTLVVTGTTTISSATFDVVLDDAANNFTGAVSVTAKDVTLVDTDAIILGASTVTGNLNVTAKGVTDTGTLVVTGTTTISSATFDVVLDDAANNFTGAVSVTAKDVTLVDTDAIILGASTVTGNLNVTAKGVTDTGTLSVTGTTTISSATFDVVLDDAANNFTGAVSVTAKDVTLVDTDAIILGASTVTGNLNVTAKGVTDTGTLSDGYDHDLVSHLRRGTR